MGSGTDQGNKNALSLWERQETGDEDLGQWNLGLMLT